MLTSTTSLVFLTALFALGFACSAKLAALLFLRTRLSWKLAATIAALLGGLGFLRIYIAQLLSISANVELANTMIINLFFGAAAILVCAVFMRRAHTAKGVPLTFAQAAGLGGLTVALSFSVGLGIIRLADSIVRQEAALPSDFAIEALELSPESGGTLVAGTPLTVTLKYRFSRPWTLERVHVIARGPNVETRGVNVSPEPEPGAGTYVANIRLARPGKIDKLILIVNNPVSVPILHKEIPVDYTFVANPALKETSSK